MHIFLPASNISLFLFPVGVNLAWLLKLMPVSVTYNNFYSLSSESCVGNISELPDLFLRAAEHSQPHGQPFPSWSNAGMKLE